MVIRKVLIFTLHEPIIHLCEFENFHVFEFFSIKEAKHVKYMLNKYNITSECKINEQGGCDVKIYNIHHFNIDLINEDFELTIVSNDQICI